MIEKRISILTNTIESFNNNKYIYQNALNKSNFNYHLTIQQIIVNPNPEKETPYILTPYIANQYKQVLG